MAKLVQPTQALQAAKQYLSQKPEAKNLAWTYDQIYAYQNSALQKISTTQITDENTTLYFIMFSDANYAVVSAEDNAYPVLAYSVEGLTRVNDLPPAFYWWLSNYSTAITDIRVAKTQNQEYNTLWNSLVSGNYNPEPKHTRSVVPLLTTMWNQDWPYNALCPSDPAGPGGKVYAGCVATAMGMVMKYWDHPTTGTGNHTYYASGYGYQSANFGATTYLWDQMPDAVGTDYMAVATLLYHCGVAVNMGYAPDGSGAQSTDAAEAMVDYFGYPNAQYVSKDSYTNTAWNDLMTAQIDNGSPVYYSGHSTGGGHAFVLDGYDTANHFHFNFGWSGSSNGYFNTTNINGFSDWNGAIINSIPANYSISNIPVKLMASDTTVGSNFNVTIKTNPILGNWNINHYDFELYYDYTYVNYVGYTIDGTISQGGNISVVETSPGTISVSWDSTSNLAGGGNLVKFTFAASEQGDYLFDLISMNYNTTPVTNTTFVMVYATPPVATLAQSSITLSNIMHLAYNAIGSTSISTTYLLPSWNVTHYQFNIAFAPDKLEYVGFITDDTMSSGLDVQASETAPGILSVTCDNPAKFTGAGVLLKLQFMAIGNSSSLSVTQIITSNFMFNNTSITAVGNANVILSAYTSIDDEVLSIPSPKLEIYPNPFTDFTSLKFSNGSKDALKVSIYNLKGQLVNSLSILAFPHFLYQPDFSL
ncbi:MAG: C10 family peptidase [Candidatus Methanomethylophilaceae archaeon]|jgi:hypothetical protein